MSKEPNSFSARLVELLNTDPGQDVKGLANQLNLNRTFLAGYLSALEEIGLVRSKKIGPARIYFKANDK